MGFFTTKQFRHWLCLSVLAVSLWSSAEAFSLSHASSRNHVSSSPSPTALFAKKRASSIQTTSSSRQNRVQPLLQWAQEANIQVASAIQLESMPGSGLGWKAVKPVPQNSVVLQVPSAMALSVEAPGEGPNDSSVLNLVSNRKTFRNLPWFVQMAVYLYKLDQIDATRDNVNVRPWLDSLPRQFDTLIHWQKSALEDLQYSYLVQSVQRQERTWKKYHEQLQRAGLDLSWNDFCWGCECARSRAFSGAYTGSAFNPFVYAFTLLLVAVYVGLNLGTIEQAANGAGVVLCASIFKDFVLPKLFKSKRYVICPLIDMANHASVSAMGDVSFEYFGNAYSLAVSQDVASGNEICISYGSRSNDQLLQYYGFVEANNPHDVYVMPPLREWDIDALEKACGRTFAPGRLQKLDRAGLLGGSAIPEEDGSSQGTDEAANRTGGVVVTRASGMDPAVLQALRALVSTDAEWDAAGQAVGSFAQEGSGGAANEACAILVARTAMKLELASKATTLQEDEALLERMATVKSLDVSTEEQLAVRFRIEKKRLLLETIDKLR